MISTPIFQAEVWGRTHQIFRGCVDSGNFISTSEISAKLTASLLRWPYFTLLQEGNRPPPETYTVVRDVISQHRGGFPDAAAIRRYMDGGASLKLNQLADWHRPTKAVRHQLEELFRAAVATYVFWTPAEQQGMLPHRDASHVLAVQLEGLKEWHLYARPDQLKSAAGLDVDASEPTHTFTLEPGDVLYLPHGWPHAARAVGGASMHLTFTLAEPSPTELIEALLGEFTERHQDLVDQFHLLPPAERSAAVLAALQADVAEVGAGEWVDRTLRTTRETVG